MVAKSLHGLFHHLAKAKNEHQLRMHFMDTVGEYFGVQHWGIYLSDENFGYRVVDTQGIINVEQFVESYDEVGRPVDPVMHYVMEHHAPAHEQMVLPPGAWKQSQLYQNFSRYYDMEHIIAGPIVGGGRLVGIVRLCRIGETKAFTQQDIVDLSAVCTHMSACLATIQIQKRKLESPLIGRLTPREIQIAQLIAQGFTNKEIARELWISPHAVKQALKRMFRKLEVSTRAEMVAKLQDERVKFSWMCEV